MHTLQSHHFVCREKVTHVNYHNRYLNYITLMRLIYKVTIYGGSRIKKRKIVGLIVQ